MNPRPLRVVLVWKGDTLEERVFEKPQLITVGTSRSDTFTVPPTALGDNFPLFKPGSDQSSFVLTLGPGMAGKISVGGEAWAVSEFLGSGRGVERGDGQLEQPLTVADWGIISLDASGDVAFFFQFVDKGLRIGPPSGSIDRFFGQALAFSFIVNVAILLVALLTWEPTDALDLDPPPTTAIAKILLEVPREEKPEDKKKGGGDPRKRREEDSSKRAAGKEGKIGNPDAKNVETKIPRGPRDQIAAKVSNLGLLGTLKAQKGTGALKMLLSDTPDATMTTAMAGLKGTELVVGRGSGGTSTRGEGPGGGGTGPGQLLGVGNLAVGGGGRGRPGGGGGSGGGPGGGRVAKELKVTVQTGTASTDGGLSREQILKVVLSHQSAIQFCYEKELQRFPHLAGTVKLAWKVDLDGRVESVRVESSSMGNASAESCMARQVKNWQFPKPNGVVALVSFPFIFKGQ